MDVIAPRPGRHRRGGRAARHRADRGPARAAVAARPRADPLLRRRSRRAEGGGPRRAARPAPPRPRPHAALRRPARRARTPTISSAPAAARRSRPCSPPPSRWSSGCGATSVEAEPLDTPEARAGLKQRLIDHAATIADPDVRELYRDEWLQPLRRPRPPAARRAAAAPFTARAPWKKSKDGRFVPPAPRPAQAARAIGQAGSTAPTARALVARLRALSRRPIGDHVEALAALPIADRAAARLRDRMLDSAMAGARA